MQQFKKIISKTYLLLIIPSLTHFPNGSRRLFSSSLSINRPLHSSTSTPPSLTLHPHHLKKLQHSCHDLGSLKKIHAFLVTSDKFCKYPNPNASELIPLYAQFNDLDSAVLVFKSLSQPSTFIWNSIIKAHVDNNLIDSAFTLFKCMRKMGVVLDTFTFPIMNRAVVMLESGFLFGEMLHCLAIRIGLSLDLYFCNTTIDVYLKGGSFDCACQLFDEMADRDLVSWTSMISGYVWERDVLGAFRLFNELRMEFEPNYVTVMVMLQGCCDYGNGGRQLHGYVYKNALLVDQSVCNSLLKMYSSIGGADDAELLFGEFEKRDVVSWNIMISFYYLRNDFRKLADCFRVMQRGLVPSVETLTLLVSTFAEDGIGKLLHGKQVHCLSIKSGLCDSILKTSLLDFYAKCIDVESSEQLFTEIPCKHLITWNAMMSAFIHNGYFTKGIELFRKLLASGVEPASELVNNLIVAYSHMGALLLGKGVHGYVIKNSMLDYKGKATSLDTSIVNMYIRCGSIGAARICFGRMAFKDIVAWTSMIEGLGTHGLGFEALKLFQSMVNEGIEPNKVTFLGLLSSCSHSGMLREGWEVFYSMKWQSGIEPDLNHYTCIVDLLGRSGNLKEALAIILKFVVVPDSRIWGALLSASRIYENQTFSEFAAERLFELEPDNVGYYTVLSNVQASLEGWSAVEEVRNNVRDCNLIKQPGWSCLEVKGLIHGFVSGDRSHHNVVDIYKMLDCLRKMQDS